MNIRSLQLAVLSLAGMFLCLPAWGVRSDAQQPIHIEGDDAKIDQHNETIVYTGAVEVVQGTLRVSGDKMIVKIKGDQVEQITTVGKPAHYKQQLDDDQQLRYAGL